jgi:hypothetical protein
MDELLKPAGTKTQSRLLRKQRAIFAWMPAVSDRSNRVNSRTVEFCGR